MYTADIRNDYTLADAFQTLGLRLYGPDWSGYEVLGHKVSDPGAILAARVPLEEQLDQINIRIQIAQRGKKEARRKAEIVEINGELKKLRNDMGEISFQLSEVGEVRKSEIEDHAQWARFEQTEGILLDALRSDNLTIMTLSGQNVPPFLWAELPEGFGYDIERSLIFWPSAHSSKKMDGGRIAQLQFETWLLDVIPLHAAAVEAMTPWALCRAYLQEEVRGGEKRMTRDEYMSEACSKFDGLSVRKFLQVWSEIVPESWKSKGRRKSG